jgi:XTP/dITP diphosphohydrolase
MARPWPDRVVLATANRGKVAELRDLLAEVGSAAVLRDLPEPVEDAPDYAGNASIKARAAAAATGLPALGDDVGLEVEALDGEPGLRTRRWAEGLGGWGAAQEALRRVAGSRATFCCALALCLPDGTSVAALGVVRGFVVAALPAPDGPLGPGFPALDGPLGPGFPALDGPLGPGFPALDGPLGPGFPALDGPLGPGLEPCFVAEGTDRALPLLPPGARRLVHHRCRAFDGLRAAW